MRWDGRQCEDARVSEPAGSGIAGLLGGVLDRGVAER